MPSLPVQAGSRAFVVMPFGRKTAPDGSTVDFDRVYERYLAPAVEAAGLQPHRADAQRQGGSIHADMFQELLLAELVVADLTLDNPNVWYEIGVRHALRASGAVLTYALRDRLPFDLAGQRMLRYTLAGGVPDPEALDGERAALALAIQAARGGWPGRRTSPVYAQLPYLQEPHWKALKVGEINEAWQALEAWQSRIEVARLKQRPGDILVLADEAANRALELEALRTAARTLLDLRRPRDALAVLERAQALDPDDVRCRQMEGIALGRLDRFEQARETLHRLAARQPDGETLGLLGRTWKDQWLRLWRTHPSRQTDALAAARDTAATLARAAEAYCEAFRAAPADYYPGINALVLGRLWEWVAGRHGRFSLASVAAGVRWAVECALARGPDYWALVTRAEMCLLEGRRTSALDGYGEAVALALANRDRFALDSSSQTLDLFAALAFQPELVEQAARLIDGAERQLDRLSGGGSVRLADPARVVLFSGHMVDRPGREPRFPEDRAPAAAARIAQALDALGAGPGDLGISQAAAGGDLLFAHACLERGMQLEVHLPQREPEFLAGSVSYAAPHWQREYDALRGRADVQVRVMPDELGPAPQAVNPYDRCNRWMLHEALSRGAASVGFIALWDGKPGDGPGGTHDMVWLVRALTGRQPVVIDPVLL